VSQCIGTYGRGSIRSLKENKKEVRDFKWEIKFRMLGMSGRFAEKGL